MLIYKRNQISKNILCNSIKTGQHTCLLITTLLPGISWLCIEVYYKKRWQMVSKGCKGTYGSQNCPEESRHETHGCDGDVWGAPDSVYGQYFMSPSLSSNTQLEQSKAIRLSWTEYLVNPASIKYNECTGTKDIEYIWKIPKKKLVNRLIRL